jgi:hypothetical protein
VLERALANSRNRRGAAEPASRSCGPSGITRGISEPIGAAGIGGEAFAFEHSGNHGGTPVCLELPGDVPKVSGIAGSLVPFQQRSASRAVNGLTSRLSIREQLEDRDIESGGASV